MPLRLVALLALAAALAPAPADAKTRIPGVRTPTDNIACLYVPGPPATLHCTIERAVYRKRLEAHCAAPPIGLDWAGFELTARGRAAVSCSGGILYDPDSQLPTYRTLPYGATWRQGAFTCSSHVEGLTCTTRGGHGLFLARERYRVW